MIKWFLIIVVLIGLWGGLWDAISFKDSKGDFSISINKEKAMSAFKEGASKATVAANNIQDKVEEVSAEKTDSKKEEENKNKHTEEVLKKLNEVNKELKELKESK